jgi:hypothetical protein
MGADRIELRAGPAPASRTACGIRGCVDRRQIGPTTANTQILHALYVAAHATAVVLTGYERDLQHRLEVGARRRQPLVERPTALEVESAGGMIARFDAVEQLAAGPWRRGGSTQPTNRQPVGDSQPCASEPHWLPGSSRPTGRSPVSRTRPIWFGSPVCKALIATTTVVVSEAARGEA